ncbi:hypothetical protein DMN91_009595 [Ooceraea biroi]|uniref:Peptidoglycan binding-like domain-containing protein n=1 Tax=Ooceraea biroi TaxID=2015173 RepID=A0A3L8DAM3_OOCBI|nr:hypothetical protein DMN91_009595 [Ooceraea biroi]
MCSIAKMMHHIVVAALLAVFASGAPRSSIIYADDKVKFGGIPVTGEIDEATKKLMKARRCGLPDQPDPRFAKTRHKRFTIHGQQWPYRNLTWR